LTQTLISFPAPLDALDDCDRAALEPHVERVTFLKGTRIFRAGDIGDACYFIDDGVVRIALDGDTVAGSEIDSEDTLNYMDPGTILGELSLLDGLPRSASAYAHTDVQARRLTAASIASLQESHPNVAWAVLAALGRDAALRLRQSTGRLAEAILPPAADPQVDAMIDRAVAAQAIIQHWSERDVDALLRAIAHTVAEHADDLAAATVNETRLGDVASNTIKIRVASLVVYRSIVGRRGQGPIASNRLRRVTDIASPAGVIFALTPVSNPVATYVFKVLIAIKSRNALVVSPHRRALGISSRIDDLVRQVLQAHGAPVDLVQCVRERTSRAKTEQFMTHDRVALILATGGSSMVKAAYRSGKPAFGVGSGNAPVLICGDAPLRKVARSIVSSKSFDHGMTCGAENNLVVVRSRCQAFVEELERAGAAVLTPDEAARLAAKVVQTSTGRLHPRVMGQPAASVAAACDIRRRHPIRVIVIPTQEASAANPFAHEKLLPLVSLFTADDEDHGIELCRKLLAVDGLGHTAVIHTRTAALATRFGVAIPASRILVNIPSTYGIVGLTTGLVPSFTLGCGTYGGTSTTDNITYSHLLNIKRLAYYSPHPLGLLEALVPFDSRAPLGMRLVRAGWHALRTRWLPFR